MIVEFDIPSPVSVRQLTVLVRALCAINVDWLQKHPRTPDLYRSGVRYASQPRGIERFKPIPVILQGGTADCDQLAPWRAAELRVRRGIKAVPEVRQMEANLFHVFVRLPNGRVEDPSAWLGMRIPRRLIENGRRIQILRGERTHHDRRQSAVAAARFAWAR